MLRVYRGWIFTPDSTEKEAEAKKGAIVMRGSYQDIVAQVDKYEYARARSEEGLEND